MRRYEYIRRLIPQAVYNVTYTSYTTYKMMKTCMNYFHYTSHMHLCQSDIKHKRRNINYTSIWLSLRKHFSVLSKIGFKSAIKQDCLCGSLGVCNIRDNFQSVA